ncbi:MAG: condensation domain-containing protein, partial [Cyanobacteria bacterium P01_G01_bin.49]
VSWRILLEDLVAVYQQLTQEQPVKLPPKTTSYQDWAKQLLNYSHRKQEEIPPYLPFSKGGNSNQVSLPMDYPTINNNTVASSDRVCITLSLEQTHALQEEVSAAYHAYINEVLLAALTQSICQWTGQRSLVIDLEGHGREDLFEGVNLSRTVGWFTAIFPVGLELNSLNSLAEVIKSVKEQFRRISKKGIDYGVLRYLKQQSETQTPPEINFNYLGQIDAIAAQGFILGLAKESVGWVRSPRGSRRYLIEITGAIAQKQLQLTFTYSRQIHHRETVEALAQKVLATLDAFIVHCQSSNIGGHTPSDFASANLSQKQLDQFLGKLKQSGKKLS